MSCANCAATIERTPQQESARVIQSAREFCSERAAVTYLPRTVSADDLIARRGGAASGRPFRRCAAGRGCEARARNPRDRRPDPQIHRAVLAPCALLLSMGRDSDSWRLEPRPPGGTGLFWVLATPVQFYTGWDYYSAGQEPANRSAKHDVLVAMGPPWLRLTRSASWLAPASGIMLL